MLVSYAVPSVWDDTASRGWRDSLLSFRWSFFVTEFPLSSIWIQVRDRLSGLPKNCNTRKTDRFRKCSIWNIYFWNLKVFCIYFASFNAMWFIMHLFFWGGDVCCSCCKHRTMWLDAGKLPSPSETTYISLAFLANFPRPLAGGSGKVTPEETFAIRPEESWRKILESKSC